MKDENPGRYAPVEHESREFLSYYLRELQALCYPATPLFAAAVYCLVVSIAHYYREDVYQLLGSALNPGTTLMEARFTVAYGIEGLWYFVGPSLAVVALSIIATPFPSAKGIFPRSGLRDFGLCMGSRRRWKTPEFSSP